MTNTTNDMAGDRTPALAELVRTLIAGRTYGNVSVAALLTALDMTEPCVCGKPAAHLYAEDGSDEWACRIPASDLERLTAASKHLGPCVCHAGEPCRAEPGINHAGCKCVWTQTGGVCVVLLDVTEAAQ